MTNLVGRQFGDLLVTKFVGYYGDGQAIWETEDNNGNKKNVFEYNLKNGHVRKLSDEPRGTDNPATLKGLKKFMKTDCVDGTRFSQWNRKIAINNTSGVTGVSIVNNGYIAQIKFKSKVYHLGFYKTIEEATFARKEAEENRGDNFEEWFNNRKTKLQ